MSHFVMLASDLSRQIEDFLHNAPQALVIEDGQVIFDLSRAKYSLSSSHNKCVLEMWSDERNQVRRVEDVALKNGTLRLKVRKFGQAKPHMLEICAERDRRTPAAKRAQRSAYERMLELVLKREFPDFVLEKKRLSASTDLEHSFGPAYARGLLRKGRSALAVLGVGAEEAAATVDAALAIALLWLNHSRDRFVGRGAVEAGLLFVPAGASETVRARAAHLRTRLRIFELDGREETVREFDATDGGNVATRLVHCPNEKNVRERYAEPIAEVLKVVPGADVVIASASEVSFRWHGLEFARARSATSGFERSFEITYGAGRFETKLSSDNEEPFRELMQRVVATRRASGPKHDPLWRMQPERWLESEILQDITAIDERLDATCVYSQVPAFAASDRAMIDVLARTRSGRLAVIELKADEDLQLPMQGLDYWSRVHFHQQRGEFRKFGYFPERELTAEPPLLYLVAPALRVHPSTDALLRSLSPQVEWTFVGVNEDWRNGVRVIFRKSPKA